MSLKKQKSALPWTKSKPNHAKKAKKGALVGLGVAPIVIALFTKRRPR